MSCEFTYPASAPITKICLAMNGFTDPKEINQELILRDYLALQRTKLANERTLFSYIRTSLYLLTVGIGMLQIESISSLRWLAWVGMLSGFVLFFLGFIRFCRMHAYLQKFRKPADNSRASTTARSSSLPAQ